MLMRLVRPVVRSGSSLAQFVQRIPADVRALAIGKTVPIAFGAERVCVTITAAMTCVRFSLRTSDPAQVKVRHAQACGALAAVWDSLRQTEPVCLSHKQYVALAGDLYRGWVRATERTTAVSYTRGVGWEPDLVSPNEEAAYYENQTRSLEALALSTEAGDLERPLGPIIDLLLQRKGVGSVAPTTRWMLLEAALVALKDALEFRARNALGGYSPDLKAERFPDWVGPELEGAPAERSGLTLTGLLAVWWREAAAAGRKPSTYQSYSNTMNNFVSFLQHDDAQRVTPEDIVRFKEFRLHTPSASTGRVPSAKTVKDSDLAGLRTIFGWAVAPRTVADTYGEVTISAMADAIRKLPSIRRVPG